MNPKFIENYIIPPIIYVAIFCAGYSTATGKYMDAGKSVFYATILSIAKNVSRRTELTDRFSDNRIHIQALNNPSKYIKIS